MRTAIQADALRSLIDLQLRVVSRPGECTCRAPLPFMRPPPKPECSNWALPALACVNGCDWVLQGIRDFLKTRYNLA